MLSPNPFVVREIPAQSFIAQLLRRPHPTAASAAIECLLASAEPREVRSSALSEIVTQNRLGQKTLSSIRRDLFARAYRAVVVDGVITETEAQYLAELRRFLDVGEDVVIALERGTIVPRFARAVADVLADGTVTQDERIALDRLADGLRLSTAMRKELYAKSASELLQRALNDRLADRRLSPDEFTSFAALAQNLGITPTFDAATERLMHRYALLWRIEQGDIPSVPAPISLQRGEVCHLSCSASWSELRTRTVSRSYSGVGTSIRICRGVSYRVGTYTPTRITAEELTEIDSGVLYFTSKRVIFDGAKKNTALRLASLLSFSVYADGMVLEKASGRSPHLMMQTDIELAATILGRLLSTG